MVRLAAPASSPNSPHDPHPGLPGKAARRRAPAGLFDVGLELLGLVLVDALLDGLGGLVDERLGLLEAQAGGRADDLDDLDLLVAGAREDDVEGGLLLGGGAVAVTA